MREKVGNTKRCLHRPDGVRLAYPKIYRCKGKVCFFVKSTDKVPKDAIPFDTYGAEFTHYGDDCTFETFIKAFNLKSPGLTFNCGNCP